MTKCTASLLCLFGLVQCASPNQIIEPAKQVLTVETDHLQRLVQERRQEEETAVHNNHNNMRLDPYLFEQALEEAAANNMLRTTRNLQQDPTDVCNQFNAAANGTLDCTCKRYDVRDTSIFCNQVNACNEDESTCIESSVEIIIDMDALSKRVTSCTFAVDENEMPINTCVTVLPLQPANYTVLNACFVELNGENCNYCEIQDMTNITFDCCNVMDDKKSANTPVGPNGRSASPRFDDVVDEGSCRGRYDSPVGAKGGVSGAAATVAASFGVWSGVVATLVLAVVGTPWL